MCETVDATRGRGIKAHVLEEIERLESMIADRRELYNDQVYRYNTRIAQVPAVVLAGLLGWRARPFFEAPESDRGRPDADLRADTNPQPD